MKKFFVTAILGTLLAVGASPVWVKAAPSVAESEFSTAQAQLNRQITLLQSLEKFTERSDLGRLFMIKNSVQQVLDSVHAVGIGHMSTIRQYQSLIVAFRFSGEFFARIQTEKTAASIQEILGISESIAQARGFDDSPYTQITKSIFSQMKKMIDDLNGLPLQPALKQSLQALTVPIGNTVAIASQGDRPRTFAAGNAVHLEIVKLYPMFNEVAFSNPAFEIILNIQGLNEFYAEFAQLPPTL